MNQKKKTYLLLFLTTAVVVFFITYKISITPSAQNNQQPGLKIVTSFYPLYEIAHQIGKENITVNNLVPAGAEPHDYEPTPQDIVSLTEANLIIYNGSGLEPWIEKVIPELERNSVQSVNVSESEIIKNQTLENDEKQKDPHFWLDPLLYLQEAQFISRKISNLDPKNANAYLENTRNFAVQINELDQSFRNNLKNCESHLIVTSHNAFSYLAKRYNLEIIAITGISPDAEPSPNTLAQLSSLIKEKNIKYIFTETLLSSKAAETLARETGIQTLTLNPLEGLSSEQMKNNENYFTVMKENLKNLETALNCKE